MPLSNYLAAKLPIRGAEPTATSLRAIRCGGWYPQAPPVRRL